MELLTLALWPLVLVVWPGQNAVRPPVPIVLCGTLGVPYAWPPVGRCASRAAVTTPAFVSGPATLSPRRVAVADTVGGCLLPDPADGSAPWVLPFDAVATGATVLTWVPLAQAWVNAARTAEGARLVLPLCDVYVDDLVRWARSDTEFGAPYRYAEPACNGTTTIGARRRSLVPGLALRALC